MRGGFIKFWAAEGIKREATFVIENWRNFTESPVFKFLYGIEAVRRKLLTEEETKKLIEELGLWLAQDTAIKRRKPRGDESDIQRKLFAHRNGTKVWRKVLDRLGAVQEYNRRNYIRQWLAEQTAINNENLPDATIQHKNAESNGGKHSRAA